MQVVDVKINEIDVTENVRLSKGDVEIKQLMESIKQHGLKQAIGVVKTKKGNTLLYGFRRLTAYKKLGYNTIPAVVADEVDEKDHLIINTIENIQRRNVTPYELGRICIKLQKLGLTVGEISARLNATKGMVDKAIIIYKRVPEGLRDKVAFFGPGVTDIKGKVSAQLVYNVMQLAKAAGLSNKEGNELIMAVKEQNMASNEITNLAQLLNTGLSIKEALQKNKDYKVIRVDITVKDSEFKALKKKHRANTQDLIRMIAYGMVDGVTRPSFIKFTTIKEV
jgi:ParB family transcriptional regulator, chromosome partitioning protein